MVELYIDNKPKTRRVAQLVLEAFVGPRPDGMESCHWPDTDVRNNSLENLRWATHHENILDKVKGGTVARGERSGMAKLTEQAVIAIRSEYVYRARRGQPGNAQGLAERYGVDRSLIHLIVKRKFWKHVP